MKRSFQTVFLSMMLAIPPCGAAERPSQEAAAAELERILSSMKISCSTLAIAEYSSEEFLTTGAAVRISFAASDCATRIVDTTSRSLLEPVMLALAGAADLEVDLQSETKAEREKRIAVQKLSQGRTLDGLQANFKQLFADCNALGQRPKPNATRVCYFGVPTGGSGGPSRAAFQAMLNNSLPKDESLCAPEKIADWNTVEPEFMPFHEHFGSTFSWSRIRQSLEQDGFRCSGEGGTTV